MIGRPPRAVLLAAATACSALVGHALDEAGLLPGVHEAAAVRQAAGFTGHAVLLALWPVLAAATGLLADRLLRRGGLAAAPALALGQILLCLAPEIVGRADVGAALLDPPALAGAGLQALLALALVGLALLLDQVWPRLPGLSAQAPGGPHRPPLPAPRVPRLRGRISFGWRGRAPPRTVAQPS